MNTVQFNPDRSVTITYGANGGTKTETARSVKELMRIAQRAGRNVRMETEVLERCRRHVTGE